MSVDSSFSVNSIRQGIAFATYNGLTPAESELFYFMLEGQISTKELSEAMKKPLSTVQNSLARLRMKGLVEVSNVGKDGTKFYSVSVE